MAQSASVLRPLRRADRDFPRRLGRKCGACGAEHFPRVDPVVIMLAEYEERVLVGRQHQYPAGRYSALAGFVEPGELIEEAVARELLEEAGVAMDRTLGRATTGLGDRASGSGPPGSGRRRLREGSTRSPAGLPGLLRCIRGRQLPRHRSRLGR